MKNSADVRKENKNRIRAILYDGKARTKAEISERTGLSFATCSTLLNALEDSGEVGSEPERLGEVGRASKVFRINEDYEQALCVWFDAENGVRSVKTALVSLSGKVLSRTDSLHDLLEGETLLEEIGRAFDSGKRVTSIMMGVPSLVDRGELAFCDIEELEGFPIVSALRARFGVPLVIENDMYFRALGYYEEQCGETETVTVLNYPKNLLPGGTTVHKGEIITGKNGLAGMVGFLPFEMDRESQKRALDGEEALPLMARGVAAMIAAINPDRILLTGALMSGEVMEEVKARCLQWIPESCLPEMVFRQDTGGLFLQGMIRQAVKEKLKNREDREV